MIFEAVFKLIIAIGLEDGHVGRFSALGFGVKSELFEPIEGVTGETIFSEIFDDVLGVDFDGYHGDQFESVNFGARFTD